MLMLEILTAVKKYLKDADIVHHLAGITDVARTKDEQNFEKDKEMNEVAEKGTSNILSKSHPTAK